MHSLHTITEGYACITHKLRVDLQNWADYVFDSSYELMDLKSIEQYIAENKHLPGMPSANQIEKEGADIGEIVKMQQVKIEELTLYMIELKKENEQLTKRVKKLEKK